MVDLLSGAEFISYLLNGISKNILSVFSAAVPKNCSNLYFAVWLISSAYFPLTETL